MVYRSVMSLKGLKEKTTTTKCQLNKFNPRFVPVDTGNYLRREFSENKICNGEREKWEH